MSSRQLRKLQKQRDLEQVKHREENNPAEISDEEEAADDIPFPASKQNLFANFAALEDLDSNAGEDEDEDENENEIEPEATHEKSQLFFDNTVEESNPAKKSKKIKNKKKKKGKSKKSETEGVSSQIQQPDGDMDEIDTALKELHINSNKTAPTTAPGAEVSLSSLDPTYRKTCFLLQINTQHLKVANEMKNLFGRSALDNHDDAGGQVPGGRRRQQARRVVDLETALKGHHAPGRGFPEVTLRRNIFIQGKDDWPRATTGGLSMENLVKAHSNGAAEFTFVHDQNYKATQQQFNMFVEMGDPQNLIGLLQRNPYHISLLLQVSKIAKDQGDHALSSDLVERALFSFARATTSLFATSLSNGYARLQFSRRENREFWLAGYQYIKSLIMKGTYRTALEWAKLLLIMDVSDKDPYSMLLMVHHLALRAHEFEWLLELSESSIWSNATIHEEDTSAYASHITPSLAFAALQLKDGVKCRSLLRNSIQTLPWLFCRLFQELNLDNPPPSIWGAQPRTDAENLFTELYIRQTKDLWNTPEATALLVEVADATTKLNDKEIPKTDNSAITLDVARFVYLDNTPALMALVPSGLLHRKNNSDSDPLPPDDDLDGVEGLHTFYDPIAALRRLIPGWTGNGGAVDEEAIDNTGLRDILEAEMNREAQRDNSSDGDSNDSEEEFLDAEEGNGNSSQQVTGSSWLYNVLFGRSTPVNTADDEEEESSVEDVNAGDGQRH